MTHLEAAPICGLPDLWCIGQGSSRIAFAPSHNDIGNFPQPRQWKRNPATDNKSQRLAAVFMKSSRRRRLATQTRLLASNVRSPQGGHMQQVIAPSSSHKRRRVIVVGAVAMVVIFLAAIVSLALRWPFSRAAVLKELGEASMSRVDAGTFHATYFPRPGCILEHVTFQHNPKLGSPPLITIERLGIEGSFSGLFTKHVRRVRAQGMRVLTPPQGSNEHFQTPERSPVVIDELVADGGILEVASARRRSNH